MKNPMDQKRKVVKLGTVVAGTDGAFELPEPIADPDEQNDERAEWAQAAVKTFMSKTGVDKGDELCDLLADLAHWADRHNMDFGSQLLRAKNHYEAETMNESGKVTGAQFEDVKVSN